MQKAFTVFMIAILCLNLNAQNSGMNALTIATPPDKADFNRVNLPSSERAHSGNSDSSSSATGAGAVNLPACAMREI
jgi:hypothetical protein